MLVGGFAVRHRLWFSVPRYTGKIFPQPQSTTYGPEHATPVVALVQCIYIINYALLCSARRVRTDFLRLRPCIYYRVLVVLP